MSKRTIFIGDLQGCYDEFINLLNKLDYNKEMDVLYLVGDTINRGPKSHKVLDFLIENPQIKSVLGNHEYYFLKSMEIKNHPSANNFNKILPQLKQDLQKYISFLQTWPLYIEKEDWILVHAGLLPEKSPSQTDPETLLLVREITHNKQKAAWFKFYKGEKKVIFGHWARLGLVDLPNIKGLDSGCVYGRTLSAYILEENVIINTPAIKMWYDPIKKHENW